MGTFNNLVDPGISQIRTSEYAVISDEVLELSTGTDTLEIWECFGDGQGDLATAGNMHFLHSNVHVGVTSYVRLHRLQ
jgi:hypothetical protein